MTWQAIDIKLVITMYVDTCKTKGKYIRHLLREGYREDGKVKHRTIANLSDCSEEEIEAIRLALRHKEDLTALVSVAEEVSLRQGLSVGSVWLVYDMAKQLGITKALGNSRQRRLALWQVIARVINQGSRLSAVRLASSHAVCDIMDLGMFNEDDLYQNLDWLCEKQSQIENILFRVLHPDNKPGLFLYDVTSSYLEGECNDLAAFGYNRDGKKGKRQIVIGLLCNEAGKPLSIEVFAGNIQDQATLASQIRKVSERFGGDSVTFVGDRGMIKSKGVEDLLDYGFHYITAITKPQIESLLNKGVIQMGLFDQALAEVETNNRIRYVLRRNPLRSKEVKLSRESKLESLRIKMRKKNQYLREHPRASLEVACREVKKWCEKLRLSGWVKVSGSERKIDLFIDEDALAETAKLDGCYVLKTDLTKKAASKETVHDRYKDLALVEQAFRTSKTVELEIRPVYVQRESRTRGHALVVMLAYKIVQELAKRWRDFDLTVQEGINELTTLCAMKMIVKGKLRCNKIPEPRASIRKLLNAAAVRLPQALPCKGVRVATRKKLTGNRKPR